MSFCDIFPGVTSVRDREELVYSILASLPRSSLATVQRRIVPMLQLDIVGLLPYEIALQTFSYLPYEALLACSLVNRRWCILANDQSLWKRLCATRKWGWKIPHRIHEFDTSSPDVFYEDSDDEGMGDEEDSDDSRMVINALFEDSGYVSAGGPSSVSVAPRASVHSVPRASHIRSSKFRARHSAPPSLPSSSPHQPNFKLLYQTHVRLRNRMHSGSYRLSYLQNRGTSNGHTSTIYCLQLYTYPDTGTQVLFTGSKDRTVREWDLSTGTVVRVIGGVHDSSVLSICVYNGLLASAGSDRRVAVWNLATNSLVTIIGDHLDSVLCVRFDDDKLVSCSKDRTVRTYTLPDFTPQFVLRDHRAAVNAVSISPQYIVSASGDRSMRLWDAQTGALLNIFENHHGRGIASIDFKPPYILTGSSDKHLKLLDISTSQGWSTSTDFDASSAVSTLPRARGCPACGNIATGRDTNVRDDRQRAHEDLVRSVALNAEFVVSGSYDYTVKLWDRKSGALVTDLAGGHTGRIFCVGFDYTKIVSCGEDQKICIWDFSHDMDTSFIGI